MHAMKATPPTSWAERLRETVRVQTGQAVALMSGAEPDLHKAVHESRRRIKHLRALWRLVRPEIAERVWKAENRRLRDAARLLAEDRDAFVGRQVLGRLAKKSRKGDEKRSLAGLRSAWPEPAPEPEAAQVRARNRKVVRMLQASEAAFLALGLPEDAAAWGRGLKRTYRAGRRLLARAAEAGDPEAYHEARKHTKYLMYQMQSLASRWAPRRARWLDRLDRLQTDLGDLNDLAMVRRHAENGAAAKVIDRRIRKRMSAIRDLAAEVFAEKPGAFVRAVERTLARRSSPPSP